MLQLAEVFYSIQGERMWSGTPNEHIARAGAQDYRRTHGREQTHRAACVVDGPDRRDERVEVLVRSCLSGLGARNSNAERFGRDAVGDHLKRARASVDIVGYVEVGPDEFLAGGDRHRAVVVSAGVEDILAASVRDAHERIVRRGLILVAKSHRLR